MKFARFKDDVYSVRDYYISRLNDDGLISGSDKNNMFVKVYKHGDILDWDEDTKLFYDPNDEDRIGFAESDELIEVITV